MTQYEMFSNGRYLYTLGANEDPTEALDAEQRGGGQRLSVTRVTPKGRETDWMAGSEPEPEPEEDFEYEEEEFSS